MITVFKAAFKDGEAQRIEEVLLDGALERAGTENRIKSCIGEVAGGFVGDRKMDVLLGEAVNDTLELDFDDFVKLGSIKAVEDNDFVDTVEELGAEELLEAVAHQRITLLWIADILNGVAADVAGHDDDRVLEINRAPLSVSDAAVVEHLKQRVEDIRMSFFNLIKQDDTVWATAHSLTELTSFFVTDISWRCTDQTAHAVLLHVLAHVDAGHCAVVIKEELGERFAQFGFPDAGGTKEQEAADRAVLILNASTRAAHRIAHGDDGIPLSDDACRKPFFHLHQFGALTFLKA